MENIKTYFETRKETLPCWLANYDKHSELDYDEILNNRIVYYAGAGLDGEIIKTFNEAKASHTFIYVDYIVPKEDVIKDLINRGLLGYKLIDLREFDLNRISVPNKQQTTIKLIDKRRGELQPDFVIEEYGIVAIFERRRTFDESHGGERIALIYLGTDAITAYLRLFNKKRTPFVNVIQDHGMGGNYTTFGRRGFMHEISKKHAIFSEYAYVASNTRSWDEYRRLNLAPIETRFRLRYLFEKIDDEILD